MERRGFLTGLVALSTVGMLSVKKSEAAVWVKLGTRQVNGSLDYDRIIVRARAGKFDKLKLLVKGNDLMIYDLDVRYSNGGHDDIPVRSLIPQGGETRVMDLRGGSRSIRHVNFKYGKFAHGKGATWGELWARR